MGRFVTWCSNNYLRIYCSRTSLGNYNISNWQWKPHPKKKKSQKTSAGVLIKSIPAVISHDRVTAWTIKQLIARPHHKINNHWHTHKDAEQDQTLEKKRFGMEPFLLRGGTVLTAAPLSSPRKNLSVEEITYHTQPPWNTAESLKRHQCFTQLLQAERFGPFWWVKQISGEKWKDSVLMWGVWLHHFTASCHSRWARKEHQTSRLRWKSSTLKKNKNNKKNTTHKQIFKHLCPQMAKPHAQSGVLKCDQRVHN